MAVNINSATIQKISVARHAADMARRDTDVDRDTGQVGARVRDVDKEEGAELSQRINKKNDLIGEEL